MPNKIFLDTDFFKKGLIYKNPEFHLNNRVEMVANTLNENKPVYENKIENNIKNVIIGTNNNWKNFGPNPGFSSLKNHETINIGKNKIYITDPYGIREWKNKEHSTGIDFKTDNGKVIAIKDGEIIDINLQGSDKAVGLEKTGAGYYIKVKHTDGSYGQYMHLDPISEENKKDLIGRKIKRGDEIWGYTQGSGSMTGKHVKFRLYGQDPKVNIDPSQAFRGENYSFIPNSYGENIL